MAKVLSDQEININKKQNNKLISYLNNSTFNKKISLNKKQKTFIENNQKESINLTDSLKSAINSSNKEKIEWIINQKIVISENISNLNPQEIDYLIDFLIEKLSSQKSKSVALSWLEEILKSCFNIISQEKIHVLKASLQPHILNFSLIMETLSRINILKDIKNKIDKKYEKSEVKDFKMTSQNKHKNNPEMVDNKHKISVIYNEVDSDEEAEKKYQEKLKNKFLDKNKKKVNGNSKKNNKMEIDEEEEDDDDLYDDIDDENLLEEDEEEEHDDIENIDEDED
jgi:hypothetical protein